MKIERKLKLLGAGLLLFIAYVVMSKAWHFATSQIARRRTLANQLTTASEHLRLQDPSRLELSLLLAIESARLHPSLESDKAIRTAMVILRAPLLALSQTKEYKAMALSPDGRLAALAGPNGIEVIVIESRQKIAVFKATTPVALAAFSPNGDMVAIAPRSRSGLELFEISSNRTLKSLPMDGVVSSLVFSGDNRWVVAGTEHSVQIIDTKGKREPELLDCQKPDLLAFNFDSSILAIAGNATLSMISLKDGRPMKPCNSELGKWRAVAFSRDSPQIAKGNNSVIIVNQNEVRQPITIDYPQFIKSMSFSSDGKLLITTAADNVARIFGTADRCLLAHFESVEAATPTTVGKFLIVG